MYSFFRQLYSIYYRYPVCNIILLLLRGSSFVPFLLFLLPFIKYLLHIYMQDSALGDGDRRVRLDRFSTLKEVSFLFGRKIVNKQIHNCHFNYSSQLFNGASSISFLKKLIENHKGIVSFLQILL